MLFLGLGALPVKAQDWTWFYIDAGVSDHSGTNSFCTSSGSKADISLANIVVATVSAVGIRFIVDKPPILIV